MQPPTGPSNPSDTPFDESDRKEVKSGQETEEYKEIRRRVIGMLSAVLNTHPDTVIGSFPPGETSDYYRPGDLPDNEVSHTKTLEIMDEENKETLHDIWLDDMSSPGMSADRPMATIDLARHTPSEIHGEFFVPESHAPDIVWYRTNNRIDRKNATPEDLAHIRNGLEDLYANIPRKG